MKGSVNMHIIRLRTAGLVVGCVTSPAKAEKLMIISEPRLRKN